MSAKVEGYGVKGESKALDTVILVGGLVVLAGIGYLLWKTKKAVEKPIELIEGAGQAVYNQASKTVAQVTNPQNTISALAPITTYQGAITANSKCPYDSSLLAGDSRCVAPTGYNAPLGNAPLGNAPLGYETQGSIVTRLNALPEWEQALINAGNFFTGGLASQAGAVVAGKTLTPSTKYRIGDTVVYMGKTWTVSGITPTNYLLDDGYGGSFNPLISEVDGTSTTKSWWNSLW